MTKGHEQSNMVMQDFIFGALEADEGMLQRERASWSGLRHGHAIQPLYPQPHHPVQISVTVGPDVLIDRIAAYITTDCSDPVGHRGQAENGLVIPLQRAEIRWHPLLWDYVEIWQGEIPGQPLGTHVRYRIQGWREHEPMYNVWSRELNLDRTVETPTLYGYSVDAFQAPAWAHEAIVYQIFVDRFAPAPPYYLRPARLSFFSGGNLQGVLDHLDYIVDLGVTTIWLSPIFKTRSYHGYDVLDYYEIDPHFGSKEDLRALISAAHERGLRVILDFVANHTSDQFPPFQEALHNPDSPYRAWFSFSNTYKHGYRCFFDVPSMPQLNLDHLPARAYILDAARYWLREFSIDGYRLDYAAGPSHDFWTSFRLACKEINPDCWIFGEVTLGDDDLRTYAGRLDGCLDFNFTRQIRRLLDDGDPAHIENFANSITRTRHYFPADFTHPTFLENHDMNRIFAVLHGDKQRLRLAAGLMMALGGTPILYYGTEVGLSQPRPKGPHREESRHPMRWGEQQDRELLAYFQQIVHLRRRHPALVYGDLTTLRLDPTAGVWMVSRQYRDDHVLLLINNSDQPQAAELPAGEWRHSDGSPADSPTLLPARTILFLETGEGSDE